MKATEKVMEAVKGLFWTRPEEMDQELEKMGYVTVETPWSCEYTFVQDVQDEKEYILYLGHANRTMWVQSVEEA